MPMFHGTYSLRCQSIVALLGVAGFSIQQNGIRSSSTIWRGGPERPELHHALCECVFRLPDGKEKRYGKLITVYSYVVGSFLALLSLPAVAL